MDAGTTPAPNDDASGFASLGLGSDTVRTLTALGYEEPTPIQREAIPILLTGRDLLGRAATGTGKTAAFALPIVERLSAAPEAPRHGSKPRALVLTPTRELAMQVSEAIYKYGRAIDLSVVPVYGGQPIGRQLQALARGVQVVVATPGRAVDHITRGSLALDAIEVVVLDEADEMLDMGFAEEIDAILSATPTTRQTVLFSATMPARIDTIARRHLRDPASIHVRTEPADDGGAPLVREVAYVVARAHKPAALGRILDVESPTATIVFCRTRTEVDQLTETLNGRGYRAEALHGGMDQEQRDRVMGRLRAGTAELLVATDVAARGLDIDQLTHVVNFDVPSAPESYVHRIGRVGRAGREGVAITLAEPRERRMLGNIERLTRRHITVTSVPTVAELRVRQIEITLDTLRTTIAAGDLDRFRPLLETLGVDHDAEAITLAAIKLAHVATGAELDEPEIPDALHAERAGHDRPQTRPGARDPERRITGPVGRLFIGTGRHDGVRPQDLVGALANESALTGADIGAITISTHFSIVEVPEAAITGVIEAMARATIKGRKVVVRRDRDRSVAVSRSTGRPTGRSTGRPAERRR